MLKNPYYIGKIKHRGAVLDGAHEPIVDDKTWHRVQDVLAGRRITGDRSWRHTHPLKGSLVCGRCGGRMGYGHSRGKGGVYSYFFCLGRHTGRTNCDRPYMSVEKIEAELDKLWDTRVTFTPTQVEETRASALSDLHEHMANSTELAEQQASRLVVLERRKQKLIDAYLEDAIPAEELKPRQIEVAREIAEAKSLISNANDDHSVLQARLETVLSLLSRAGQLWQRSTDDAMRWLLKAVFEHIAIDLEDEDGVPAKSAHADATCRAEGGFSAPVAAVRAARYQTSQKGDTGAPTRVSGHHEVIGRRQEKPPANFRSPGVPT